MHILYRLYRAHGHKPFERAAQRAVASPFMVFLSRRLSRRSKHYRDEDHFWGLRDKYQNTTFCMIARYDWSLSAPMEQQEMLEEGGFPGCEYA